MTFCSSPLHHFFCRGVNFLFIKSLCRFCVSQPLEEIPNEVSDLLCSLCKVEFKDQSSTDWWRQKQAFWSFFGFVLLCFLQRLCAAFRLGRSKPKSERVAEGALVFVVAGLLYLLVLVPNTAVNRSPSAGTFPLVRFGSAS